MPSFVICCFYISLSARYSCPWVLAWSKQECTCEKKCRKSLFFWEMTPQNFPLSILINLVLYSLYFTYYYLRILNCLCNNVCIVSSVNWIAAPYSNSLTFQILWYVMLSVAVYFSAFLSKYKMELHSGCFMFVSWSVRWNPTLVLVWNTLWFRVHFLACLYIVTNEIKYISILTNNSYDSVVE